MFYNYCLYFGLIWGSERMLRRLRQNSGEYRLFIFLTNFFFVSSTPLEESCSPSWSSFSSSWSKSCSKLLFRPPPDQPRHNARQWYFSTEIKNLGVTKPISASEFIFGFPHRLSCCWNWTSPIASSKPFVFNRKLSVCASQWGLAYLLGIKRFYNLGVCHTDIAVSV